MELNDDLTHLQRAALEGDIAFLLSSSPHDAEIKFRIYLMLSELDEFDRIHTVEILKEQTKFDESIIDRILLEIDNGEFPIWLWVEKSIADIKETLTFSEGSVSFRTSIEKTECRKKIITSAFIMFLRKTLMVCPEAVKELCKEVEAENELSFLHPSCFYIMQWYPEIQRMNKNTSNPEGLLDCYFDIRSRLSYTIESQALSVFSKPSDRRIPKKTNITGNFEAFGNLEVKPIIIKADFSSDQGISQEELSNYLSEKITELFEKGNPKKNKSKNVTYIVRKVFNNAQNQEVVLKECKTKKEAEQFVEQVKENFPELLKTCSFLISRNDKKE